MRRLSNKASTRANHNRGLLIPYVGRFTVITESGAVLLSSGSDIVEKRYLMSKTATRGSMVENSMA